LSVPSTFIASTRAATHQSNTGPEIGANLKLVPTTAVMHVARPWKFSAVEWAGDDPYTIGAVGELKLRVDASSALLERAGSFVRRAVDDPSDETVAEASIASQRPRSPLPKPPYTLAPNLSNSEERARRLASTVLTVIGAMHVLTQCTIRSAGNIMRSAITGSMESSPSAMERFEA
jgi:hypothetical protein